MDSKPGGLGAIGTQFLFLSVWPTSLILGFLIAVIMSNVTAWWTLWRMRDVSTRQMLSGVSEAPLAVAARQRRGRRSRSIAVVADAIAGLLLILTLIGVVPQTEAFAGFSWRVMSFFVIGITSLVSLLSLLAWWMDADDLRAGRLSGVIGLGLRNASRHRGRSVLTASLIASATFVIVAVAAGRRNPAVEEPVNNSGNGGFTLLAESTSPVLYDLNSEEGRVDAGFELSNDATKQRVEEMRVMPISREARERMRVA